MPKTLSSVRDYFNFVYLVIDNLIFRILKNDDSQATFLSNNLTYIAIFVQKVG